MKSSCQKRVSLTGLKRGLIQLLQKVLEALPSISVSAESPVAAESPALSSSQDCQSPGEKAALIQMGIYPYFYVKYNTSLCYYLACSSTVQNRIA